MIIGIIRGIVGMIFSLFLLGILTFIVLYYFGIPNILPPQPFEYAVVGGVIVGAIQFMKRRRRHGYQKD